MEQIRVVYETGHEPANHPFVHKYIDLTLKAEAEPGVVLRYRFQRATFGMILADYEHDTGNTERALEILEGLPASRERDFLLCRICAASGRFDRVIELTDGVRGVDAYNGYIGLYRAQAFRERGQISASREVLKPLVTSRTTGASLRHRALIERATGYLMEGKRNMARKDADRILADTSQVEGLSDLVRALSS
jgi:hypothetical protein